MPIGIFLTVIFMIVSIMALNTTNKKVEQLKKSNGDFDKVTSTFTSNVGRSTSFLTTEYAKRDRQKVVETIETALARTCRTVSTLAHANNCAGWDKASYTWGFAGTIGTIATIDTIAAGTTTLVFSCATNREFGRGLFQRSLPSSYFLGQGYFYDFTNIDDTNADPCGYINLVRF
jgi:energy-converting hydrogenase Eha subunit H